MGVVALFGYLNRWNDSMGTELENPAVKSAEKFTEQWDERLLSTFTRKLFPIKMRYLPVSKSLIQHKKGQGSFSKADLRF